MTGLFALPAPFAVIELAKRLRALDSLDHRRRAMMRVVGEAPALPMVRLLGCAQREAAMGSAHGRLVFDVFGSVLAENMIDADTLETWAEAAEEIAEVAVALLLRGEGPVDEADDKEAPRGSLAAEGETLGRRKSLARTAHGDTLEKLLIDPHPDVVRELMSNPRLVEGQAVRLAARTKAPSAVLEVLGQSKFMKSPRVRLGLATNPRCPPPLACRVLPSLKRHDLVDIAHDKRLHPSVRQSARVLLDGKPPR